MTCIPYIVNDEETKKWSKWFEGNIYPEMETENKQRNEQRKERGMREEREWAFSIEIFY